MKIYITGGAGFIGSNLVRALNVMKITPIVVDVLTDEKWKNLRGLSFVLKSLSDFKALCTVCGDELKTSTLIHLGANVDTTEKFNDQLWKNNFVEPLSMFKSFDKVIYASSGAVYGAEESDFTERIYGLKPLNAYGFTKWALDEAIFGMKPRIDNKRIHALRFFNVYGPNETHKGNMQSVVSKAINHLTPLCSPFNRQGLHIYNLFKSDRPDVKDGGQQRDFIYVEDVCNVIIWFLGEGMSGGVYNLGSGKARSFIDLIRAVSPSAEVNFCEMPETLKGSYQYFTQADMRKLRAEGYHREFTSLEDGVCQTLALTKES